MVPGIAECVTHFRSVPAYDALEFKGYTSACDCVGDPFHAYNTGGTGCSVSTGGSSKKSTQKKGRDHGPSEERLRLILENLPVGVVVHDDEMTILSVNSRAEVLFGLPRLELIGRRADHPAWNLRREDGTPLPSADHPVFRAVLTGAATGELTLGLPQQGRSEMRHVLANATPIFDQDGTLSQVVMSLVDLTEKRRHEEQQLTLQKLEALGVLAGGIAHDFNNLLGGIFGYLEGAMDLSGQDDAKGAGELINKALGSFERARALTRQLLTFAKGGAPVTKVERLQRALRESAELALGGSEVKAAFALPDDLWPARVDLVQVGQAFGNLVLNSRQAMPLGGTIEIKAENVKLSGNEGLELAPGDYVRIQVIDEGTGIPADQMGRIFDPFYSTKQSGTGLGLSTTYSIVNRHGGCIRICSTVGEGTTATVYLPAISMALVQRKSRPRNQLPALKGRAILVMDDELPIREVSTRMLTSLGLKVTTCSRGEDALRIATESAAKGSPFDIFLLDLTIPGGLGGKAVVEPLGRISPEAILIASSGYSDDPVMADPSHFGFTASIAKPYTRIEVEKLMVGLLETRE